MRVHQNTWGRVSEARKQVQKLNNDILNFRLIQLVAVDASRSADEPWCIICACTMVFPAKMIEQTIMTSQGDVMRTSCA